MVARKKRSGPASREASQGSAPASREATQGSGTRIASGKNRRVQIVQEGGRKLFDKKRKEVFLEWFAATCNVKYSAHRAGVCYQTVFKHRMKDEAFAEMWDRCLRQGYARVEAQSLETKVSADQFKVDGDWEAPELQEMDPMVRIALLREHRKSIGPSTGSGGASPFGAARKKGQRPRTASNEEVRAALVKRLVVFGVRIESPAPGAEAG